MKIAIVGRGTSSIITTLVCLDYGHDIEIFYDPNVDFLSIGESSPPHIPVLLDKILGIKIKQLIKDNICSIKSGVKFINWGKGNTFYHTFSPNISSFHLDSKDFNVYVQKAFENIGIKYHAERVDNYKISGNNVIINEKIYDFVFFCTGWDSIDEYKTPILSTVNSAVLFFENEIYEKSYTVHKATEDGWQFEIPFPQKKLTRMGYLYNRNLISKEEILNKLTDKKIARTIEWTPRYSKKLLQNKHVAYNGNRLFFVEPLQALSFFYYYSFTEQVCQFLKDRTHYAYTRTNVFYQNEIFTSQVTLAFHYKYGSVFNTEYWKQIVSQANHLFEMIPNTDLESSLNILKCIETTQNRMLFTDQIFQYEGDDFKQIHCGMTGEKIDQLYEKIYNYESN